MLGGPVFFLVEALQQSSGTPLPPTSTAFPGPGCVYPRAAFTVYVALPVSPPVLPKVPAQALSPQGQDADGKVKTIVSGPGVVGHSQGEAEPQICQAHESWVFA